MARRDNHLRDSVILKFIMENQPCSSTEIIEGAKFANGKLLKQHKRLSVNIQELNPILRRNPIYIGKNVGGRGRSVWLWSLRT
tara:strand:+ start:2014 stop:2262 length:249 start_codon:yes stop_codon:yes gene_type:complete